jgi:hypothetical protein
VERSRSTCSTVWCRLKTPSGRALKAHASVRRGSAEVPWRRPTTMVTRCTRVRLGPPCLGMRKAEGLGLRWDGVDLDAAEPPPATRPAPAAPPRDQVRRIGRRAAVPAICVTVLRLRDAEQEKDRLAAGPGLAGATAGECSPVVTGWGRALA